MKDKLLRVFNFVAGKQNQNIEIGIPFNAMYLNKKSTDELTIKYRELMDKTNTMNKTSDEDDLEETPDVNFDYDKSNIVTPPPSTPATPTTGDLCKQWFISICENISIKKTYNSNMIGDGDDRYEYPYLSKYNNRYALYYKDFKLDLTDEEGDRLNIIFKESIDMYYNNIFKTKLAAIERAAKRPKSGMYHPGISPSKRF